MNHSCKNKCSGWDDGYRAGQAEKDLEIEHLKMQLQCTNTSWPYEKELYKEIEKRNAEIKTLYDTLGVTSKSDFKRLSFMLKGRDEEIEKLKADKAQLIKENREAVTIAKALQDLAKDAEVEIVKLRAQASVAREALKRECCCSEADGRVITCDACDAIRHVDSLDKIINKDPVYKEPLEVDKGD